MNRRDKDTKLEASPQLFRLRSIVERMDWREVFAKPQPLEVDLGCGDGTFLVQIARTFPDHNFLGVERLKGRALKTARKLERAELTNARVLRLESNYAVEWLFPAASVAAYHILFPDPWPKRRHHKFRLLNESFLAGLHKSLIAGGAVNFVTDHEEYFREATPLFLSAAWKSVPPVVFAGAEWRTDFECEFVKEGRSIFRARFEKI